MNSDLAPVEDALRRDVRGRVGWRNEQVIFFAADPGLGYREVATVLSDLQRDNPGLNVVLVTRSQIGAIDGTEMRRIGDLCVG